MREGKIDLFSAPRRVGESGPVFKITVCDLKDSATSAVSWNMKSDGNLVRLRVTAWFSTLTATPYRPTRSVSKTLCPRRRRIARSTRSNGMRSPARFDIRRESSEASGAFQLAQTGRTFSVTPWSNGDAVMWVASRGVSVRRGRSHFGASRSTRAPRVPAASAPP